MLCFTSHMTHVRQHNLYTRSPLAVQSNSTHRRHVRRGIWGHLVVSDSLHGAGVRLEFKPDTQPLAKVNRWPTPPPMQHHFALLFPHARTPLPPMLPGAGAPERQGF